MKPDPKRYSMIIQWGDEDQALLSLCLNYQDAELTVTPTNRRLNKDRMLSKAR